MKKIAVVSGKGGTGKTMVTAGLAGIVKSDLSLADCDVEASNFELLYPGELLSKEDFHGLDISVIDTEKCVQCGACLENCRFGAVEIKEDQYSVRPLLCEGCGVCDYVCPSGAISMKKRLSGEIFCSATEAGPLAHARLEPGSGNSGLLVNEVKKRAARWTNISEVLLIDGPPGTGCPLISTVSGMGAVLAVTEPSISGLSDLSRLVEVCKGFRLRIFVVINRYDLEESVSHEIEEFCRSEELVIVGKIPFDPSVISAIRKNMPVTMLECPASDAIKEIWENLSKELDVS
ncbi:Cobyrinic acid ac-diamide synthase [Methanolacinia petrolearia DSM 11571]|uniref:Cobyrinic acid ac-diamide synthase n=1 Tax=Methanolacinia petrolearia (strain DSM 11571 / OCM 486 / SEBR 4847) TaxID=679926 RepID=E1RDA6_METP4|nr:ATP-binding protein [Methanolacinia petrolearia]ADN37089.1 Cobyrinic acid ac-diamide synthase [Methanolacinia petrolearia DSM 11571]